MLKENKISVGEEKGEKKDSLLPLVQLGLESLTEEEQKLMRYFIYLAPDYIPLDLVKALLGLEDETEVLQKASALEGLSLIEQIQGQGEEGGFRIHREIQQACKNAYFWQGVKSEASSLLKNLIQALLEKMPFIDSTPNKQWGEAKM
jgi:hypothetical protein